jgi:3'-5' exoribonuclease
MARMNEPYRQTVSDIRPGVRFDGWLLVKEAQTRATANGKKFLDASLVDRTGSIPAKWWDFSGEPPAPGTVVRVRGIGNDYNGHLQLRVDALDPARPEDGQSAADYVPAAPETPKSMLAEIAATAAALRDRSLRGIVEKLLEEANEGGRLLAAPAAKTMHHAEVGGLLHHTVTILRAAKALAAVYPALDKDLLYAGVIAHDLGKLDEMQVGPVGLVEDYTRDGRLVGHIVRGVVNVERAAAACGAARERATLLQHLVLSHHGQAEFGSPVPPKCPEAEVLSLLDRLDAKLFQMFAALRGVEPGAFSAPVWGLDKAEIYRSEPPAP